MVSQQEARRQVSRGRKIAFYGGYALVAAGLILLVSPLLTGISAWTATGLRSTAVRVLIGLCLIPAGIGLRRIGIRGLAGSMVVLDPPRARTDLEPWSRAAGGLVDAALSEIGLAREAAGRLGASTSVSRACVACGAVNDGEARFCDQCGKEVPPGTGQGKEE